MEIIAFYRLAIAHANCSVLYSFAANHFGTVRLAVERGNHDAGYKLTHTDTPKDCTPACVKAGAKFVLYSAPRKATYELDDRDKARDFAGQKVKVIGSYDKADKTIHVESIEAGS